MSDLGQLLELLHGAFERYETCRATIRDWSDPQLSEEAIRRWTSRQPRGTSAMYAASARRAGSRPEVPSEQLSRWWIKKPSRLRNESGHGDRGTHLMITNGRLWWRISDRDNRVMTNEGAKREGSGMNLRHNLPILFDPARIIPTLDFQVVGWLSHAGRRALRARASPREIESPPILGFAGEYELAVDADIGVILSSVSAFDGKPYRSQEVVEVEFNAPISDDLFVMTPQPGARVETIDTIPRPGRFRQWWWRRAARRRHRAR